MDATPTLDELLAAAAKGEIDDLHVALPCCVTDYDSGANAVDVQPTVSRIIEKEDGTKLVEQFPVIHNVPIAFPGCGDFGITFPCEAGATGLLVFCDWNIGQWYEGTDGDPGDQTKHGINGAVFWPGLRKRNSPLPTEGGALVIVADQIRLVKDGAAEQIMLGNTFNGYRSSIDAKMEKFMEEMKKVFDTMVDQAVNSPGVPYLPALNLAEWANLKANGDALTNAWKDANENADSWLSDHAKTE